MHDRILQRIQRCTFCNSMDIHLATPNEIGIIQCLCRGCGNKWGQ